MIADLLSKSKPSAAFIRKRKKLFFRAPRFLQHLDAKAVDEEASDFLRNFYLILKRRWKKV